MSENIYYSPKSHGLEIVGEIQWGEACYDFDLTVIWRDLITGELYYQDDSGCSCPLPFEDCHSVNGLIEASVQEIQAHLEQRNREGVWSAGTDDEWIRYDESAAIVELMGKLVG